MALSGNIALKATQGQTPFKYLKVTSEGHLVYEQANVLSQDAKFAVENGPGNMVHIRSCSSNKYWMSDPQGKFILATADEPVDNQTSPACTLFRVEMVRDKIAKFYHVQTGRAVCLFGDKPNLYGMVLNIDLSQPTTHAESAVVDYDSLVVLPKFVALQGSNKKYFGPVTHKVLPLAPSFISDDIGDPEIVFECVYTGDGYLRLRSVGLSTPGRDLFLTSLGDEEREAYYWEDGPSQLYCSSQLYDIIRVGNNKIALRSHSNNFFCIRETLVNNLNDTDTYLIAKAHGAVSDTHLAVVEPVSVRRVNVFRFDVDRARIYDLELLSSKVNVWNNRTDKEQSGNADCRIKTSKSKTFTNSINVSASVETTFSTGVPFIAKGEISITASASYTHEWAEEETEEQEVGHGVTVVILPQKTTRVVGTATKAKCDVPFAYVQRDHPSDGGPVRETTLYDGVFKGANAYNFESTITYEELPPTIVGAELAPEGVEYYVVPAENKSSTA